MTNDELRELVASLAIAQKKTDEQIRCLLDIQKESERKIKHQLASAGFDADEFNELQEKLESLSERYFLIFVH